MAKKPKIIGANKEIAKRAMFCVIVLSHWIRSYSGLKLVIGKEVYFTKKWS